MVFGLCGAGRITSLTLRDPDLQLSTDPNQSFRIFYFSLKYFHKQAYDAFSLKIKIPAEPGLVWLCGAGRTIIEPSGRGSSEINNFLFRKFYDGRLKQIFEIKI
jgi:hypothetical protein